MSTAAAEPSLVLLTVIEAADLLRVSTRTIRRWVKVGRLRAARTTPGLGGRVLLRRSDLLALVGIAEERNR